MRKSFTLVELITVMLILGILILLIMPLSITANKSITNITKEYNHITITENQYANNLLNKESDIDYKEFNDITNSLNSKFKDIYNKNHKKISLIIENKLDNQNIDITMFMESTMMNSSHISKLLLYEKSDKKLFYLDKNSDVKTLNMTDKQLKQYCLEIINEQNKAYNSAVYIRFVFIKIVIISVILDILLILLFFRFKYKLKVFKNEVINCLN